MQSKNVLTAASLIRVQIILILGFSVRLCGVAAEFLFDPLPDPTLAPSKLKMTKSGADLVLSWTGNGLLQASDRLGGKWQGISLNSPARVRTSDRMRFFRVQSVSRPLSITIPSSYVPETAAPLILSLHG
ncbi:MAG: hypothetical protein AB1813_26955, partial [Verrucomicrobiota bacterium]